MTALAPTLQAFFTDRLMSQRQASRHTIAAYRDTFRLLLGFAAQRTGIGPSTLDIGDLDAPLVAAFLHDLEHKRGNSVRTRNARLCAIHSLFAYAALHHPEHAASIQRVLAIPPKRFDRNLITYLTEPEVDALLAACDRGSWTGRRDHAMLLLTLQTGLRISELIGLSCADVVLGRGGRGGHVHTIGKGRKQRRTPLLPTTIAVLRVWLAERGGAPSEPLLPTITGRALSRDAVERRIAHYTVVAGQHCPSLATKQVTAHTLRHTCAMRLLLSGVDITVIALWLGHEQVATTQIYLHADMTQKERAIARTRPTRSKPGRYQPPDPVLAFLEAL
jgi:site-specific recombinase XerD